MRGECGIQVPQSRPARAIRPFLLPVGDHGENSTIADRDTLSGATEKLRPTPWLAAPGSPGSIRLPLTVAERVSIISGEPSAVCMRLHVVAVGLDFDVAFDLAVKSAL